MSWLHSWIGLLAGWILYFVFVTGSTGLVHHEITRWMRPELPLVADTPPPSESLAVAQRYLSIQAPSAEFWVISFPGHRGSEQLAVSWRDRSRPGGQSADVVQVVLDPQTDEPARQTVRKTGGGGSLYVMHYALHYLSRDVGILIVGAAAMIMMVSILSGVVAHANIFRDFFTFRPGRGPLGWRSAHTLLGATALPFYLMMTWSGLIFFLFTYMPTAQNALFPDDEAMMRFNVEAYFPQKTGYGAANVVIPPSLTSPPDVLARAEALWGEGSVLSLRVDNPGRESTRVTAYTRRARISGEARVAFDIATGAPLALVTPRTRTAKVYETVIGLHEGHFAWSYLRLLYLVGGLAGTALVGTGLVHWSLKRAPAEGAPPSLPGRLGGVEVISLGTIVGLPMGLAAYFWANRLLPLDLVQRDAWELHGMFITWGAVYAYAAGRRRRCAWAEASGVAALAYGLLPAVNFLTTDRHLGVTIPAGDWVLAGFDLCALAAGALFALLARNMWRGQQARRKSSAAAGETAS